MNLFNKVKQLFMSAPAKDSIAMRPIPKNDQFAAITALQAYKAQNPVKYEQKKAALFARYGLSLEEDEHKIEPVKDEMDVELEKLAVKAKKTKNAK